MCSKTVAFATVCYWKNASKINDPDFLHKLVNQHGYEFDEIIIVVQNFLPGLEVEPISPFSIKEIKNKNIRELKFIYTSDNKDVLEYFNIPFPNEHAEIFCDGANDHHWWCKHLISQLCAIKHTKCDYIMFNDTDVSIPISAKYNDGRLINASPGWIKVGLKSLNKYPNVFTVCPGEGTNWGERLTEGYLTNIMSQQIFLAKSSDLLEMNWNSDFPYNRHNIPTPPYPNPAPYYWFATEGAIGRHMVSNNLKRLILDSHKWRFWHWSERTIDWKFKL
jgi:hypothetical protein